MAQPYSPLSRVSDVSSSHETYNRAHHDTRSHHDRNSSETVGRDNATSPWGPPGQGNGTSHKEDAKAVAIYPRRHRPIVLALLVLIYLAFLVVPWILTCILLNKPLRYPSYFNQNLSLPSDFAYSSKFWLGFIDTANAIAFLLAVPVISALLARGASVYFETQALKRGITIERTFALADRAWLNPFVLIKAWFHPGISTSYLLFASLWVLTVVVQIPLRAALVTQDIITIPTCLDLPSLYGGNYYACPGRVLRDVLAYDAEPNGIAAVPQANVLSELSRRLASISSNEVLPNLWSNGTEVLYAGVRKRLIANSLSSVLTSGGNYWTSVVPTSTNTGILREHSLSLSSAIQCMSIDSSAYPSNCSGSLPLVVDYNTDPLISARVCVPGNRTQSPWSLSRDLQVVSEELYIDVAFQRSLSTRGAANFTVMCTANTTRQYHELPNVYNKGVNTAYVTDWPDDRGISPVSPSDFNDQSAGYASAQPLPTIDNATNIFYDFPLTLDPYNIGRNQTPGPLMTAASALFGRGSFLDLAIQASSGSSNETKTAATTGICNANNIPFLAYSSSETLSYLVSSCRYVNSTADAADRLLSSWLPIFSLDTYGPLNASNVLGVALYLANEVTLKQSVTGQEAYNRRAIYTSDGTSIAKPSMTTAVLIGLTVLIGIQVLGLLILLAYIYHKPTLTATLSALAIFKLGQEAALGVVPSATTVQKWLLGASVHLDTAGHISISPATSPRVAPRGQAQGLPKNNISSAL